MWKEGHITFQKTSCTSNWTRTDALSQCCKQFTGVMPMSWWPETQRPQSQHVQLDIPQPKSQPDYNCVIGGTDLFDQGVAAHRVLHKTRKYWKSIFMDFVDVADVNAFVLQQLYGQLHPDVIQRPIKYHHSNLRWNIIRQLAGRCHWAAAKVLLLPGPSTKLTSSSSPPHLWPQLCQENYQPYAPEVCHVL